MKGVDDDPGDDGVRSLLAQASRDEFEPQRSVVRGVMKRLRLRRHGVEHINESFGGIGQLLRGLATLWSVERDPDV